MFVGPRPPAPRGYCHALLIFPFTVRDGTSTFMSAARQRLNTHMRSSAMPDTLLKPESSSTTIVWNTSMFSCSTTSFSSALRRSTVPLSNLIILWMTTFSTLIPSRGVRLPCRGCSELTPNHGVVVGSYSPPDNVPRPNKRCTYDHTLRLTRHDCQTPGRNKSFAS
jgi:hypothetical protein